MTPSEPHERIKVPMAIERSEDTIGEREISIWLDDYDDIFSDLDYSLSLITGKSSPKGDISVKRVFWKQLLKKT